MEEFKKNLALKEKRARKKEIMLYISSIAAILVTFVVYIKFFNYSPNTIEFIYNKYYKPYVVDSDLNNNSVQAIQSYRKGDFEEAIRLFKKTSKDQDFYIPHKLYLAASYTECNKFNEAIILYEEVLGSDYNYYHADASWYLALCYLKVYDLENAKKNLQSLENTNYRYEASEIMGLLKKFNN